MTAYTITGAEVEIVERVGQGALVHSIYNNRDGEPFIDTGKPWYCDRIFDQPPTEKLHEKVVELTAKVAELESKRRDLDKDIRTAEAETKARLERLKRFKGLEFLEEFIEGKITHYAYLDAQEGPKVKHITETLEECSRERAFKLLSLFGQSNGDLTWKLSRYSDGSGHWFEVFPARSEAEALEWVKNLVKQRLESSKDEPREFWIEAARKFSVPVPEEYVSKWKEEQRTYIQNRIKASQKEIEKYQQKLAAIQ